MNLKYDTIIEFSELKYAKRDFLFFLLRGIQRAAHLKVMDQIELFLAFKWIKFKS